MTVTADGLFVETDPGVGIRQPGWHGSQPGTEGNGGPLESSGGGNNNDNDGDGIPNGEDEDIDNDGIPNGEDGDTDGDGIPNGNDSDVDDDGIPNGEDDDTDGDGIGNGSDGDVDGDGVGNGQDGDIDGDGFPNGVDDDADGDGIENEADADADGDGLPNFNDPDADGDGISNEEDDDSGLNCPEESGASTGPNPPPDCPNPCQNPQAQIVTKPNAGQILSPNERFMFQATGTPAGGSYSWTGGTAVGPSNGSDYTASFATPGNHTVTVTYTCPESGGSASATATVTVGTLSGITWCAQYPGSKSTADLEPTFKTQVDRFLSALTTAQASYDINATYRPVERAYLMHYSVKIAEGTITPANAGAPPAGVSIAWRHFNTDGTENISAARAAAQAMIGPAPGYDIAFPAAYPTLHSARVAIDVTITWTTTNLTIINGTGGTNVITAQPEPTLPDPMHAGRKIGTVKYSGNSAMHAVGATYGLKKLLPDPPHWSTTGN
jgi:hypothetical protein